mgnify:CR=1 FL=1
MEDTFFEHYTRGFTCRSAYRQAECPAGLYLLHHSTSLRVTRFKTDEDHDNHVTQVRRGFTDEIKKFVRAKFDDGV